MIGFGLLSIVLSVSVQLGASMTLPNSVMSAPVKKLGPRQRMTMDLITGSSTARPMPRQRPARIDPLIAFTGGLSHHRNAISWHSSHSTEGESDSTIDIYSRERA